MEKPRVWGHCDLENGCLRRGSRDLRKIISLFLKKIIFIFAFRFCWGLVLALARTGFKNIVESWPFKPHIKELTDGPTRLLSGC